MGKIKLQVEELAVESFATAPPIAPQGTVRGNDSPNTHQISCYFTVCDTECSCLPETSCCTGDTECCLTQDPCPQPTHYATCLC